MKTAIIRRVNRASLHLQKHSPTILFGAGIVGITGTIVLACRATLKAQEINVRHKEEVDAADVLLADRTRPGYDKDTHKQHIVSTWTITTKEYAKVYGPAFILGVTSIACLTKSHQILTSRNTALTAAYMGLDSAFKGYRSRVAKELGEAKDLEFLRPTEDVEIVEYDAKGNPVKKTIKRVPDDASDIYGRWFDEGNRYWDKDPGYNTNFLENQLKWCNIELKRKGHMFLNEVYDELGIPRSAEGNLVGWVYEAAPDEGDGYIDFGHRKYPEFMAGYERNVFLDFNVDGPILGLLGSSGQSWYGK